MSIIESKRIYLRPLKEEDATPEYARWLNDTDVNQFLETRHHLQSVQSCRDHIVKCNSDPGSYLYGIFLKGSKKHIGNAKIGFINQIHKTGQLSLFIGDKTQWGKGLASEVIQLISRHGFDELDLERIEAGCYEQNLASLHAFMKAGYSVDGFLRKHMVSDGLRVGCFWLSLLKDDPTPS